MSRCSLGDYHKDSRNLKKLKDPSESRASESLLQFSEVMVVMMSSLTNVVNLLVVKVTMIVFAYIHKLNYLKTFVLSATRFRLLKHTRLNVVAFLSELPKTQHDTASLIVDVNTFTVSGMLL